MYQCKCVNEVCQDNFYLSLVLPTLTVFKNSKKNSVGSLFFTSLFDIVRKDKLDFRRYLSVKELCKTGERYREDVIT